MSTAFLLAAVVSALWGVVVGMGMVRELGKRGVRVNLPLMRLRFLGYLSEYKQMTLRETGKVGPLHRSYITAMLVALGCAVIGLLLRAW